VVFMWAVVAFGICMMVLIVVSAILLIIGAFG
jgi:hypothetical protein